MKCNKYLQFEVYALVATLSLTFTDLGTHTAT